TSLMSKGDSSKVTVKAELPEALEAPLGAGDVVGTVRYSLDGKEIGSCDIVCKCGVDKIGFFELFFRMLSMFSLTN
ncbi:MAG: D-alanyl-D-alanine carboxypeptidase, partial [Clostridia bacterium]|nr:D-alanyl-D-alanine carboxypeptidase [Clostridia bacterium]